MKRIVILLMMIIFFVVIKLSFSVEPTGKWWDNAVFYQIFPLSFYDTDADGKGDINGIIEKLDYLVNLGITAIWLTPIHPVPLGLYHGYAVNNYYEINPELGSMEDYERLIKEAHSRGIKIIMDFVMNHTSLQNPWFVGSATDPDSPYKDWYIWSEDDLSRSGNGLTGELNIINTNTLSYWPNASGNSRLPAWNLYENEDSYRNGQFFYAGFNHTIPDLNHTNPAVSEEMKKIAKFWLDKGVDGFRVDAVRYLIETGPGNGQLDTQETIDYFNDWAAYVKSVNPEAYVIGEVFAGMGISKMYYSDNASVDALFGFDFGGRGGLIQGNFQTGKTSAFYKGMNDFMNINNAGVPFSFFAPFFSNHDSGRMPEALREMEKIKAAAILFFTIPGGAPYIYYGDEIGQREGFNMIGDADKRNPMYWDSSKNAGFTQRGNAWVKKMKEEYYSVVNVAAQIDDPQSTWRLFKKIIDWRKTYLPLQFGDYTAVEIDILQTAYIDEPEREIKKNPLLAFTRSYEGQTVLVIINPGKRRLDISQDLGSEYIQRNKGNLILIDSIWSEDLTQPVPEEIAQDILKGNLSLILNARGDIVMLIEER